MASTVEELRYYLSNVHAGKPVISCPYPDKKTCTDNYPCTWKEQKFGTGYCSAPQGGQQSTFARQMALVEAERQIRSLVATGKTVPEAIATVLDRFTRAQKTARRYAKAGVQGAGAPVWQKGLVSPRFRTDITGRFPTAAEEKVAKTAASYDILGYDLPVYRYDLPTYRYDSPRSRRGYNSPTAYRYDSAYYR